MIISLLPVFLMIARADPVLYPVYQTGFDNQCNSGASSNWINFSVYYTPYLFGVNPKVIISWSQTSVSTSSTVVLAKFLSTSTGLFDYTCKFTIGQFQFVYIQWLAFIDDNLFVTKEISTTFPVTINFVKQFTSPPAVAVFIQGYENAAPSGSAHFYIQAAAATTTSVQIQIVTFNSITSLTVHYQVIYGDSNFFQPFQIQGQLSNQLAATFTATPKMKVILGGINEVDYDQLNVFYQGTIQFPTPGTIKYIYSAPGASLSSTTYTMTYFQYMPCPLYCTSCNTQGYPYCDACLPGSLRTLASNCQSCTTNSYATNSFYNCQQCMNICDTCTTGTTCTVCLTGSLRLNPPLCNQCPPQKYIQAGNPICQSCLAYCDNCQYESAKCTACQSSTGRINPPLCTQCPLSSQFIPIGGLNCESCNIYCDGCLNSSSQCLACLTGSQRTQPPRCWTCPNQMFATSTVANCQACSTYCNNCQLTSTTCTSCQASTSRINPPNCTTCPINMFSVIGQDNCQQCNPICNQCVTTANTCIACNGLYRTNSPNCDQCSMPNYYIDPVLNDCQVCASYCKGCLTSSVNCISCWPFAFYQISSSCADCPTSQFTLPPSMCSLNLVSHVCSMTYNRDAACNCLTGFYNSESSLSCLKCSNTCQTCTKSATNCIICNSSLQLQKPPTCDQCISGYLMLYGSCTQCSDVCSTCSQSRINCLTCTQPYINPPLCTCPDGLFNGCTQTCSVQCKTCTNSATNCLTCSGNRINPPICGCPDGSPQSTAVCEQCSLAKPIARFTDDLTSIEIIFSYKLQTTITCGTLFIQKTLIYIGTNPTCIANENVIIITLGSNPSISVNQPLFISPNTIQFTTCKQSTENIITPLVQMPQNVYPPTIKFDQDVYITTPCDIVVMNIISSAFSGSRNLKLNSWNIIEANNNITLSALIKQWNSQDLQTSYVINSDYLKNQQSIQLMIIYSNFIGKVSNSTIRILMKSASLQLSIQVPDKIYVIDTTQIQFVTSLKQCGQQASSQVIPLNISITNQSAILEYNLTLESDSQGAITFEPFQLTALSTYYISAIAQYINQTIQVQSKFQVILADVKVSILGGDQIIGINQQMNLEAVLLNFNNQTSPNDLTQYQTSWKCQDLIMNIECNNFSYNLFNATLNTSNYQPFTSLLITIQLFELKSKLQVGQNNITIKILENEVNQIQLTGNQYQLNQPLNTYDEVDVLITYQKSMNIDVDNLTYYASYLDSAYQENQIQFYNPQTSIIMQNFNQVKDGKFKVMVYNPVQKGPSVATLNLRLNIPPQQCKISIFPKASKFQVQINFCISESQPLQYQFVYYATSDEFIQDNTNGLIINGIKLSDYQVQPTLITYLYGQNTSLIVGFIKDSANGVSNTSYSLKNYQTIDSSLLYHMLQDTQLNLPRNILFIMKYAQLNNQILSDKYYNQILNITNTFNQTDKITQYIQQQLASQQSLSNNQITSSISTTTSVINNIQDKLTFLQEQQNSNQYNKNYQFQLITLQNELSDSTTKISFLYTQSQLAENRRLLDEASAKNITSLITETISNVTDILGQLTKVNQNPKAISTPQFNLTAQKFSTSNINQNFKLQIVNQTNQTVQFKNQNFNVNPYQNESDFNNTVKAPLIVPNLTDSKNVQINPVNPIPFDFAPVADANVSCASKVGGSWSMDLCSLVKSSTKLQCLCQTLSPLSIAQALLFILQQFDKLFQDKITDSLATFPYAQALFTYIIALFVTLYFVFMVILYRRDHYDQSRVYPVDHVQQPNSMDKIQMPADRGGSNNFQMIIDSDLVKSEDILYTKTSIIGQVKGQNITKIQGFKIFIQNSHVLFELYYRYDSQEPRTLRLSILFLQMIGQICIFVLFGKNLAISIVIALSIFQTVYGVLFQLILSQMIKSKNKFIHHIGMILAGLLTGFCTYLIIAAMSLFTSPYFSNIAALTYMGSFCVDYFVSNILVELGKYVFVLKTCHEKRYYKIYDKVLPKGLYKSLHSVGYYLIRMLKQRSKQLNEKKIQKFYNLLLTDIQYIIYFIQIKNQQQNFLIML